MTLLRSPALPLLRIVNPRYLFFSAILVSCVAFACYGYHTDSSLTFYSALVLAVVSVVLTCMQAATFNGILIFLTCAVVLSSIVGVNFSIAAKGRVNAPANGTAANLVCVLDSPWVMKADGVECFVKMKDSDIYRGKWKLTIPYADELPVSVELGAVIYLDNAYAYTNKKPFLDDSEAQSLSAFSNAVHISAERAGNIFDKIRYASINQLCKFLPSNQAGIAAALLFGDKNLLSEEDYASFRYAGLAHTMAVSGLHVGFLMTLINVLLSRLRRLKKLSFSLVAVILIGYIFVCSGSVSVARAVIMGILACFGTAIGRRSDSVNNISLAAIILLLIKPFYIGDIGFLMSFLSVLSILLLMRPIQHLMNKIRIPRKLSSPISVTVSASIGVLPITAQYFHTMNLWTVPINFLALPLVEVTFMILIVALPVSFLFGQILLLPKLLMDFLLWITKIAAQLPGADFILFSLGSMTLLYLAAVFLLSDNVLTRQKFLKITMRITVAVIIVVSLVICNLPNRYVNCNIAAIGNEKSYVAIVAYQNKVVLVGSVKNISATEKFLSAKRIRRVDLLLLTDYDDASYNDVHRFMKRYGVRNIGFDYKEELPATIQNFDGALVILDTPLSVDGIEFSSPPNEDTVELTMGSKRIAYIRDEKELIKFFDCVVSPKRMHTESAMVCVIPKSDELADGNVFATEGESFFELL